MNVLGKLFNKNKNYKADQKFKVLLIEENSSSLNEALGISEERYKEIVGFSIDAFKNTERYSDACKLTIDKCNHINEVVLAITTLAKIKSMTDNPLASLFSKFGEE